MISIDARLSCLRLSLAFNRYRHLCPQGCCGKSDIQHLPRTACTMERLFPDSFPRASIVWNNPRHRFASPSTHDHRYVSSSHGGQQAVAVAVDKLTHLILSLVKPPAVTAANCCVRSVCAPDETQTLEKIFQRHRNLRIIANRAHSGPSLGRSCNCNTGRPSKRILDSGLSA